MEPGLNCLYPFERQTPNVIQERKGTHKWTHSFWKQGAELESNNSGGLKIELWVHFSYRWFGNRFSTPMDPGL